MACMHEMQSRVYMQTTNIHLRNVHNRPYFSRTRFQWQIPHPRIFGLGPDYQQGAIESTSRKCISQDGNNKQVANLKNKIKVQYNGHNKGIGPNLIMVHHWWARTL